jgi:hypothetical protein
MGSHCLWYINNPDHFPNWKISVRQKSQSTFHTGKNLPKLDYFSILKMNVLNNMSVLPPNLESHSSLSTKGVISTIPIFSQKYANFILERGFVRISVVCSSVGMYWSFTSPSWTLSLIK